MGYGRHLRQRGGAIHFRRAIPKDIAARIGRREIVRSVGALPTFERHSLCRRFGLACDEVFRIVRAETTLSRADIDRLVTTYVDDVARRDRECESWQPRRPPDEADFRRQSQIEVYDGLARSVMAGRRTRAGIITPEVLAATAKEAGVDIGGDLDAYLAEDALTEALARHYELRAEDLRREGEVGASNGVIRFLRSLFGRSEQRAHDEPSGPVQGGSYVRARGLLEREGLSTDANAPPDERGPVQGGTSAGPRGPDERDGLSSEADAPPDLKPAPTAFIATPVDEGKTIANKEQPAPTVVRESTAGADMFGKLWDEFVETRLVIRKDWKLSRRPDLLSTRRLWMWIVGDMPVNSCGSDQVRKFHDAYLLLPEDYTELRKGKSGAIPPDQVIAAAKLRAELEAKRKRVAAKPYKRVNAKTFNKHLGNLKAFFVWTPVAKLRPASPDYAAQVGGSSLNY